MLHAKAELKAAQAAARGRRWPVANPSAHDHAPRPRPSWPTRRRGRRRRTTQGTQLERLFASHDAVTARWLDYELDVAKIIAFPAMSDGRQPLTAAFLRAKRIADGLRPASAKARLTQGPAHRVPQRRRRLRGRLRRRRARRATHQGLRRSPTVERKRLDTAKQLLTVAIDQAATPAERQVAYRRVREELDGLISLSDEAIEVLEAKVSLELTTGTSRRPPTGRRTPPRRRRPDAAAHARQRTPRAAAAAARAVAGARAHHRHGPGSRRPPQVAPLTATVWRGDRSRAIPYAPNTRHP